MATREAQREYQRNWMRKRRQTWLDANGPCVDCGSDVNLEVDHVDRSTKVDHKVWSWSQARRDVELAKCLVRCARCHEAKTTANRDRVSAAVITIEQADIIRARYAEGGITQAELGRRYGIGASAVSKIVLGQCWSHS